MSGYALHPEAFTDINDIWEYIAEGNVDAADRVVAEIFAAFGALVASPHIGHRRPDLSARQMRFHLVREYLLPTRLMKCLCGLWR
jgi:plasmid stabilization system protein ParE